MPRWLKFFLLMLVVAGVGLASLPWWLGAVLRPVLNAQGITFDRYERMGYAQFRLLGVRFARPGFNLLITQVQAPAPVVWIEQRLRGADPAVTADGWQLQRITPESSPAEKKTLNGLPDLQDLARRIGPRLIFWLPRLQLTAGELRGFGPPVTLARANWQNSALVVDGLQLAGQQLAFTLAPGRDGSVVLTAQAAGNEARFHLIWAGTEIKGEAILWDQVLKLTGRFPAQGWLPSEASAVAENWRLPAARIKLGGPYTQVRGGGKLSWRDGAFDLSVDARAEPTADTKVPTLEAAATAHGNLRELTLTALHVDAPFATARLSAPITFSLDRPLAGEAARLSVQADLAKMPWFEARGKVDGAVTVSGDSVVARQAFELKFSNVTFEDFFLHSAEAHGALAWPRLEVTQLKAQLDPATSLEAHGIVNWQTRELVDVALTAKLAAASFARWLPRSMRGRSNLRACNGPRGIRSPSMPLGKVRPGPRKLPPGSRPNPRASRSAPRSMSKGRR